MGNAIRLALAAAFLAAAPASAQDADPTGELEHSLGRQRRAPAVPPALRAVVREASRDRIVIRALDGSDIVIDTRGYEATGLRAYGERFVGYAFMGYEYAGYILIDRRMTGGAAAIETGAAPVFAADGGHFAAAQVSGAGAGNLEGVGLWAVTPEGTRQRLLLGVLPPGEDWRVDGWPRAECAAVSAAAPGGGRVRLELDVGETIVVRSTEGPVPCGATDG